MNRIPSAELLRWFALNRRDLPWRQRRTAWRVWVSETMLQQTTVPVVAERFERFMSLFPTPRALAKATEAEATAAWAGLGYYRRVRNLRAGAASLGARDIPATEEELTQLAGIGPYTAAAIRAFAFNEPAAVIDANVGRVLKRLLNDERPWNASAFLKVVRPLLCESARANARDFSEALMELGALVCKPRDPDCTRCPLRAHCQAVATNRVSETTLRKPAADVRKLDAVRLLIQRGGRALFVQRADTEEILPGQWELPGAWCARGTNTDSQTMNALLRPLGLKLKGDVVTRASARHSITQHQLRLTLFEAAVSGRVRGARWWPMDSLPKPLTTESRKLLVAGGLV